MPPTAHLLNLTGVAARRQLPAPAEAHALIRAARVSHREIAAATGVCEATVSRWVHGHKTPRGAYAERYAAVLAVLAADVNR